MAFDINEFFSSPQIDETATVKRGATEFRIRRLNGAERLRFNDLSSQYDRTVYALGRCLLSGPNDAPIGEANAVRFVERFTALSDALFGDIFDLTQNSLAKESEIWAEAKKNSSPATNTQSLNDATASVTA